MEENGMNNGGNVILIGGSAGSLQVLLQLLPELKPLLKHTIVIILHRKYDTDYSLAELLAGKTTLPVKEAEEKETLQPGTIYLAPPDYHLLFEKDHTFSLDYSEKINFSRPSIDVSFESAAEVYGSYLYAILLSGASADGVEGLLTIKRYGGTIIAQEPSTAEVPFMPQQAVDRTPIDMVLLPEEMATYINQL